MRSASRSPSVRSSRCDPVKDIDSSAPIVMIPMMTTTTSISTSVNPALRGARELRLRTAGGRAGLLPVGVLTGAGLGVQVPVADVGVLALATLLALGAEGIQVVLAPVRAGIDVLVVVPPGVFERAVLDVAALAPI